MRDASGGGSSRTAVMHPPFAQPGASRLSSRFASEAELPSIQNFLDELPSIEDYVWAGDSQSDDMRSIDEYLEDSFVSPGEIFEQPSAVTGYDDAGWAIADWQSFDWAAAASLAARGDSRVTPPSRADRSQSREITPSADEVARALDGIAQRIRSGELLIDQLTGAPPEAAMAAALAALLRARD
jgi:hypothetical protein